MTIINLMDTSTTANALRYIEARNIMKEGKKIAIPIGSVMNWFGIISKRIKRENK
jgi:hypothetical protein